MTRVSATLRRRPTTNVTADLALARQVHPLWVRLVQLGDAQDAHWCWLAEQAGFSERSICRALRGENRGGGLNLIDALFRLLDCELLVVMRDDPAINWRQPPDGALGLWLGRVLREARDLAGLHSEEFATRAGICRTTLSFWENGLVVPKLLPFSHALDLLNCELTARSTHRHQRASKKDLAYV